eukprot:scaffold7461_cov18-Prasinocladus_malaysianus.AAC.1
MPQWAPYPRPQARCLVATRNVADCQACCMPYLLRYIRLLTTSLGASMAFKVCLTRSKPLPCGKS